MAYTSLTYFLDDTTRTEAREVSGHPGALVATIGTGQSKITLHGNHAQLSRLTATLTELLAQLAPETAAR